MSESETRFDRGDPVWELLGHTRPVEVSPFFARDVVRNVRRDCDARPRSHSFALAGVLLRQFAPVAACVLLAMLAVVAVPPSGHHRLAVEPIDTTIEFDVIANLDSYLADRDNAIWLVDLN